VKKQQEAFKKQQEAQLALQRQKQEMLKKQQEAQMALQKQKQEMLKKQQEDAKKKFEEVAKKKLEEQQKKMAEMKAKAEENRAAMAIRKVLQKVRVAKADDMEKVEKELEEAMTKELSNCGSQEAAVKVEVEKAVEQVKARHQQLKEAMQKQEERKAELAKKQQEAEEKAAEAIAEFEEVVAAAESATATLKEKSEPLSAEGGPELKADQVNKLAKAIDAASEAANEKVKACTEFMKKKSAEMKAPEMPGQKPSESKLSLAKLMQRISECTKSKDITVRTATSAKAKALKRSEARKKLDDAVAKLTKFDANKDGIVDKKEVLAYAKQEFKFTVPAAALDMIFKVLAEAGGKGVKKEQFQRLKVQIGVARERHIDMERKTNREKREAEVEALKVKLTAKVDTVNKSLGEVEASVKEVEEASQPLQAKVITMKSGEMVALADDVDAKITAVREEATTAKAKVTALREGIDSDVLVWLGGQMHPLDTRCRGVEGRLARLTVAVTRFRDAAKIKDKAELVALEKKVLAMLKFHQKAKSLSADALFAAMSKNGDQLAKAGFLSFFKSCEKEVVVEAEEGKEAEAPPTPEDLGRIFKLWDEAEEGSITQEKMLSLTRSLLKVAKDTVLTDGLSIKDSKSIRRLEVGEVVEVLGTPEAEGEVDVKRVTVKATKDDAEGWATVSGNQGTVFLQEGGGLYRVVKETIITGSFDLQDSTKDMPRKLKPGELVEVRVWPRKEEKTGLLRMKCKAKSDGVTGWVTSVGNTGIVFLQVQ